MLINPKILTNNLCTLIQNVSVPIHIGTQTFKETYVYIQIHTYLYIKDTLRILTFVLCLCMVH